MLRSGCVEEGSPNLMDCTSDEQLGLQRTEKPEEAFQFLSALYSLFFGDIAGQND